MADTTAVLARCVHYGEPGRTGADQLFEDALNRAARVVAAALLCVLAGCAADEQEPTEEPASTTSSPTASPTPSPTVSPTPTPTPEPTEEPEPEPETDPRFDTCGEAIDNGYGPYRRGEDPEYRWYRDADGDGVTCER